LIKLEGKRQTEFQKVIIGLLTPAGYQHVALDGCIFLMNTTQNLSQHRYFLQFKEVVGCLIYGGRSLLASRKLEDDGLMALSHSIPWSRLRVDVSYASSDGPESSLA
jgi:hypothetical protein